MLRKMNNAELAFIALDKTIKAALEVRDAILAKREELAELNNDIQEMLDEIFEANCSYATEIERIRADFDDVIGEALTEPREFTDRSEPISNSSNMRCPGTTLSACFSGQLVSEWSSCGGSSLATTLLPLDEGPAVSAHDLALARAETGGPDISGKSFPRPQPQQ